MNYLHEIVSLMQHVVVDWTTVVEPGDMEKQIPPVEEKKYYTLSKEFLPEDLKIIQPDDSTAFKAYNVFTEQTDIVSLNNKHYYGVTFNGTVSGGSPLAAIASGNDLPDLSQYIEHMNTKIDTFKYRLNTVLEVAKNEWERCTLYELIDIAKNEYGIDLDVEDKDAAVNKLVDIFVSVTMRGHSTFIETRLRSMNQILDQFTGADSDSKESIERIRKMWMSLIRVYRNKALSALDEEESTAKAGNDDQGVEEIEFIKQLLRDLPKECQPEIEKLDTCLSVMEYWPPIILPRPDNSDIEEFVSVELVKT